MSDPIKSPLSVSLDEITERLIHAVMMRQDGSVLALRQRILVLIEEARNEGRCEMMAPLKSQT